jgi:hypothetical protein
MTDKNLILVFAVGAFILFGISFVAVFSDIPWVHHRWSANTVIEDPEPVYPDHPESSVKCLKPPCYPHIAPKPWEDVDTLKRRTTMLRSRHA